MNSIERFKTTYEKKAIDRFFGQKFYFWDDTVLRWNKEVRQLLGKHIPFATETGTTEENELFGFDPDPFVELNLNLGWTNTPFLPAFEEKVLMSTAEYEIVQDSTGRNKKYPKGKRQGVMPQYLNSCVAAPEDWEKVQHRLDPKSPERWIEFNKSKHHIKKQVNNEGKLCRVRFIGGYMHLRNLFGPEGILLAFYDYAALVHEIMKNWFDFMLYSIKKVQEIVPLYEIFMSEDICFKTGPLISPEMFYNFLAPHYKRLFEELSSGQKEVLHFQIDTDGNPETLIDAYIECGMDGMSPFEVAAGCDVVRIGEKYPKLVISGGIDKRILAKNNEAIETELQRILPPMLARSGYIPTCDHGVPNDVSLENYLYYRKRIGEICYES